VTNIVANANSFKSESTRYGAYAQDQMKIADRWVVSLGGRQDWVRDERCAISDPGTCSPTDKSDALTGRAGLVYLAGNGLAPFVSFSQSWEPVSGVDAGGNRLRPTKGQQYEVGLRIQPKDSDMTFSAAVYQLTRDNVTVYDLAFNASQVGRQRSKGLELEATARLNRNLNVMAAYAYTDAHTLEGGDNPFTGVSLDGKRIGGVPRNQFSLWSDYSLGDFDLPGLRIGAGARYVSSMTGLFIDDVTPGYAVFDATASYTTGPWQLALNVTNLADKDYPAMCNYGCSYGEPRKFVGTVSYRW